MANVFLHTCTLIGIDWPSLHVWFINHTEHRPCYLSHSLCTCFIQSGSSLIDCMIRVTILSNLSYIHEYYGWCWYIWLMLLGSYWLHFWFDHALNVQIQPEMFMNTYTCSWKYVYPWMICIGFMLNFSLINGNNFIDIACII